MPEVPDLEAIRTFLNKNVIGAEIQRVEVNIPIVIRIPRADFERILTGNRLAAIRRHGKFLLFPLESGHLMIVNPMLTGRFAYLDRSAKKQARTCFTLELSTGNDIRYSDQRVMGRVYLTEVDKLASVPQFAEMGPDILDPALTEEVFRERLRRHSGQIKGILVNHKFVAGIGNAYSDEILWEAGIHPYRRRPELSSEEIGRLYQSCATVLKWAEGIVAEKMAQSLAYDEWRDHLRVHRRGGEECPRCGSRISEITAGQRITSFCRQCQPRDD